MSEEAIRIFIVDDHEGIRLALRRVLALEKDMLVVGEAESGEGALVATVKALAPHVILMDIKMPGINGLEATQRLKEGGVQSNVIVFTQFKEYLARATTVGAAAAVYKLAALERGLLANLIRLVVHGSPHSSEDCVEPSSQSLPLGDSQ